jgi:hypothetical protein
MIGKGGQLEGETKKVYLLLNNNLCAFNMTAAVNKEISLKKKKQDSFSISLVNKTKNSFNYFSSFARA